MKRIRNIYLFYFKGFSEMPLWGRKLWIIILVKLFIMFAILRLFFFPDLLKRDFDSDAKRGDYVLEQLLKE